MKKELRYLQRLAEIYPTIGKASTEIINLQSILNLPKERNTLCQTFMGSIRRFHMCSEMVPVQCVKKIDDVFGHTLSNNDKRSLALDLLSSEREDGSCQDTEDMKTVIDHSTVLLKSKTTASKYTRSKVRKALPADYAYVIEELITEKAEVLDKEAYYDSIVNTIIEIGSARILSLRCRTDQHLVVDHLHILGDIYDRGPAHISLWIAPDAVSLPGYSVGNHDVVWMGAAAGQKACIATVVRNSIRYGNLDILEDDTESICFLWRPL